MGRKLRNTAAIRDNLATKTDNEGASTDGRVKTDVINENNSNFVGPSNAF
jgi:hypothetical protein